MRRSSCDVECGHRRVLHRRRRRAKTSLRVTSSMMVMMFFPTRSHGLLACLLSPRLFPFLTASSMPSTADAQPLPWQEHVIALAILVIVLLVAIASCSVGVCCDGMLSGSTSLSSSSSVSTNTTASRPCDSIGYCHYLYCRYANFLDGGSCGSSFVIH